MAELAKKIAPVNLADDTLDGYVYQCPKAGCGLWQTTKLRAIYCGHGKSDRKDKS